MGEAETPLVAKERAAEQAMRAAAEQAGVYLESLTEVQNMRLVRDEITVLTATVLAVVDKKYSQRSVDTGGMHFTCTITARVDTGNVEKMQDRARDRQIADTLKQVQADYAQARQEIEALKQKLVAARTDADRKTVQAAVARNEAMFTATQWFERGYDFAVNRQDYDSAIEAYSKAISLNPRDAKTYINRGASYFEKGMVERAIADYDQAISLNPRIALAYTNRGNAYGEKGMYERAIADYGQAISLNPRNALAYYNRGLTYFKKGMYERAVADYDQAISLNPRDAEAYFNKALSCEKAVRIGDAVKAYRAFLQYAPAEYAGAIQHARQRIVALGG